MQVTELCGKPSSECHESMRYGNGSRIAPAPSKGSQSTNMLLKGQTRSPRAVRRQEDTATICSARRPLQVWIVARICAGNLDHRAPPVELPGGRTFRTTYPITIESRLDPVSPSSSSCFFTL